jgi:hypothetical protein
MFCGVPGQPLAVGVTVMVATTGAVPVFTDGKCSNIASSTRCQSNGWCIVGPLNVVSGYSP